MPRRHPDSVIREDLELRIFQRVGLTGLPGRGWNYGGKPNRAGIVLIAAQRNSRGLRPRTRRFFCALFRIAGGMLERPG